MLITWIGHAGFIVEAAGKRILIDPWFNPAFLGAWRPQPDNSHLADWVANQDYDYLYISHGHEDHCDKRFLVRLPPIGGMRRSRHLLGLKWQKFTDNYRDDSMLLIEADGGRALFANDCNLDRCEWPQADTLACQFSGASWWPAAYDYDPDTMAERVAEARAKQMDMLVAKVNACGAKRYIPCAGPAKIEGVADGPGTAFPLWEEIALEFARRCPLVLVTQPTLPEPKIISRKHGYTSFTGPAWVFDRIDRGECSWEDALLSMKLRLHRDVDVDDPALDALRGRAPKDKAA